jgi:hypothetical protein
MIEGADGCFRGGSRSNRNMILLNACPSNRRLPANLTDGDLTLFEKELEKQIPATNLLTFENIRVNSDSLIFRNIGILPESFVDPSFLAGHKRLKNRLKFIVKNYLLRQTIEIAEDCLWFINNWGGNYFHWMTEAIPRLYAVRPFLPNSTVLLPYRYEQREFVRSSLRAFGNLNLRLIAEDQVCLTRKLLIPTHPAESGNYNDELMRRVRKLYTNYYRPRNAPSPFGERIYVSRAKATRRRIINEDVVLSLLKRYGFKVVHFEDLSFDEQAIVSLNAKYLISNHGAGLTNMLFMRSGSYVLELRKNGDTHNNCYFSLASGLGLGYFYQTCETHDDTEDANTADLIVDFRKLRENIELMLSHGRGDSDQSGLDLAKP